MQIEEILAAAEKEYKQATNMLKVSNSNIDYWRGRQTALFDLIRAVDKKRAWELLMKENEAL